MQINFKAKYIIKFDIKCLTGLHIGGPDTGAGIGDLDNPVIKDPMNQWPIIAGSSLKGRVRERLEWLHQDKDGNNAISRKLKELLEEQNKETEKKETTEQGNKEKLFSKVGPCNCGTCDICRYFGHSAKTEDAIIAPTRFLFRDAFPKKENGYDQVKIWEHQLGKAIYTELKFENTISRLTAEANPRQMERVPADSLFKGEIVLDLYEFVDVPDLKSDEVTTALTLLFKGLCAIEQSFLGGTGSRGSGRVEFNNFLLKKYIPEYYKNPKTEIKSFPLKSKNAQEIFRTTEYANVS
jgi:CRISPR-associated protein Csm3